MKDLRAEAFGSVFESLEAAPSRFPVMTTLTRFVAEGIPLDSVSLSEVSRRLGRDPAIVKAVADFVERLLARDGADAPLYVCHGVSCTAHGGKSLHQQILPELTAAGLTASVAAVHCLNHCDEGPSLGHGDSLYLGQKENVTLDERPWRQPPFVCEND